MTDIEGRVIRAIDINANSFRQSFKNLKDEKIKAEVLATIQAMFGQAIDTAPRKWHMHQLVNKEVQSRVQNGKKVAAWTLHVTADDRYKASFTYEDGGVYFRLVDEHDVIDKRP